MGAFQLASDSAFTFEHVDCTVSGSNALCQKASGFPTFLIDDEVCTSGMGGEASVKAKLQACVDSR